MKRPVVVIAALGLAAILLVGVVLLAAPRLQAGGKRGELASAAGAGGKQGVLAFSPETVDMGQVPLNVPATFRFQTKNVGGTAVRIVGTPKITTVQGC